MRKVEHVVVLMLENRAFDGMLGHLYRKSDAFDGLNGDESNPWHKPDGSVERVAIWNHRGMPPETAWIPDPDPGELFDDINMQIFGLAGARGNEPTMDGFVDNYMRQPRAARPADPRSVMHAFAPEQVPVVSGLARAFGVSDRWHASAPCQTWPNRFFAHTGTAGGWVNNERSRFPYRMPRFMPSVFRRLGAKGCSWKIYFHDVPQAATLFDLWVKIPTHFRLFEAEFDQDARAGRLPNYSFIEPRYYPSRLLNLMPNDQHPPHDVVYGEQLIAAVYNAVRNAPTWDRTLLIVTYDEHGGCFDHVPPPAAVSPGGRYPDAFAFDRYGVRVPTVVISPHIPPGSIVRPAPSPDGGPAYPFDHASIVATLHKLFDLGPAPTARVAAAPDLLSALTLEEPENQGPACVTAGPVEPSREAVRKVAKRPRNHHQRSLRSIALLPGAAAKAAAHFHHVKSKVRP